MFDMLYPGRSMVLDSPLGVEELTRRLGLAFEGPVADGRFSTMRRVRGRNSFRPLVDGRILPRPDGCRMNVRLRLHPLVLGIGAVFALMAGAVGAIASPGIPLIGGSPLLACVLAMAAVAAVVLSLAASPARGDGRDVSGAGR